MRYQVRPWFVGVDEDYLDAVAHIVHQIAAEEDRAIMEGAMDDAKYRPYPGYGSIGGSQGNPCNKAADLPYALRADAAAQNQKSQATQKVDTEPRYTVSLPVSTIRRMAKLSPEADRKLRAQVPQAFSEVVTFDQNTRVGGDARIRLMQDGLTAATIDVVSLGPQAGRGLYLPQGYIWDIVPYRGTPGLKAEVLVARRLF